MYEMQIKYTSITLLLRSRLDYTGFLLFAAYQYVHVLLYQISMENMCLNAKFSMCDKYVKYCKVKYLRSIKM